MYCLCHYIKKAKEIRFTTEKNEMLLMNTIFLRTALGWRKGDEVCNSSSELLHSGSKLMTIISHLECQ